MWYGAAEGRLLVMAEFDDEGYRLGGGVGTEGGCG